MLDPYWKDCICCAGSVGPGWGNGKAMSVLFARQGGKAGFADEACELVGGSVWHSLPPAGTSIERRS